MTADSSEYLTPETLNRYFESGTPTVQSLSADPLCLLRIDPNRDVLSLIVPGNGDLPDLLSFERLSVDNDEMDGLDCYRLEVDTMDARYEGYSFIAAVVDAMRDGQTFGVAVQGSVRSFNDLLARRRSLTPEREQGLIGELLVLSHLMDRLDQHEALVAWLGPDAEEHDFVVADFDAEVKTTTSEKRVHIINSATQLSQSPGRPLWLISIQLTRAGASMASMCLSGLVGEIRHRLGVNRDTFTEYLNSVGWRDDADEMYRTPYMLRSLPAGYLVDEQFPAITQPRIDMVVPQPQLVGGLTYRIDVTSLHAGTPPAPLSDFVGAN
ncbi:PD-(D/E)XK motif protein [Rhodococcus sp. MS16]|nr:PD-(D/E)XK motif protein [Rhodococcus sp. MS16]